MEEFHGNLLVGGVAIKNVSGIIEDGQASKTQQAWHGHLSLDRTNEDCLQVGRQCRLELDDGRAGQVVLSHIGNSEQHLKLLVEFEGMTPLIRE